MVSEAGERFIAATKGIVPEIGILSDEVTGAMTHAGKALGRKASTMINNDAVAQLGQALQGKFTRLYDADPEAYKRTMSMVSKILEHHGLPDIAKNVGAAGREVVLDLEKLWSRNALTNKLFSGIGRQMESGGYQNVGREISRAAAKKINRVGDVAGMAAVTVLDTPTGMVNAGKKLLMSDNVTGPVKKVKDAINKRFMYDPVKQMHAKGLSGADIKARGVRRFGDAYALNPLTSDVKNLAYDVGRLQRKYMPKPPGVA